jgi:hypothetical protein
MARFLPVASQNPKEKSGNLAGTTPLVGII